MSNESYTPNQGTNPFVTPQELTPYNHAEQYSAITEPILRQVKATDSPTGIDGYLGSGTDKHAFKVPTADGPVVVKIMDAVNWSTYDKAHSPESLEETVRRNATPLIRGNGVPGLEQLLSADPDKGVLVTTLAPGKKVRDMSAAGLAQITQAHLDGLGTTLETMQRLGLHPHNAGGIFFSRKTGFNFVDYEISESPYTINLGSITSPEKFLEFALSDHDKHDALARQNPDERWNIPHDMYKSTGLRGLMQARAIKRARKLRG